MRPKWPQVVLLVLCAAFAFGGSFTCKASSGDDDDDDHIPPATRPS